MKSHRTFSGILTALVVWLAANPFALSAAEPTPPPEALTDRQAEKLVAPLERSLAREKSLSQRTLSALWQLRTAKHDSVNRLLIQTLGHSDPRGVMFAADALAAHRPAEGQPALVELKSQPAFTKSFGYRRAVTSAVSAYRNAASVDFLIDVLDDADGQFEWQVVQQLMLASGKDFADDKTKWREWWSGAKAGYRGPPADVDLKSLQERAEAPSWERPIPKFFGVPLFAKRVVFVIDRSRSMESTLDGETRLVKAQAELTNAITAMASDVQFNIVAFDDQVLFWQPALVTATIEGKSLAIQYVNSMFSGNKTASYDGLSRGLSFDPNTELIVFLSDGKPTVGQIVETNAIVRQITLENTFIRASIETLGIDTEGAAELFMYDLAKNNFGNYLRIR
jgi:hypothetical protein